MFFINYKLKIIHRKLENKILGAFLMESTITVNFFKYQSFFYQVSHPKLFSKGNALITALQISYKRYYLAYSKYTIMTFKLELCSCNSLIIKIYLIKFKSQCT